MMEGDSYTFFKNKTTHEKIRNQRWNKNPYCSVIDIINEMHEIEG